MKTVKLCVFTSEIVTAKSDSKHRWTTDDFINKNNSRNDTCMIPYKWFASKAEAEAEWAKQVPMSPCRNSVSTGEQVEYEVMCFEERTYEIEDDEQCQTAEDAKRVIDNYDLFDFKAIDYKYSEDEELRFDFLDRYELEEVAKQYYLKTHSQEELDALMDNDGDIFDEVDYDELRNCYSGYDFCDMFEK